jgi:hypothetical protein
MPASAIRGALISALIGSMNFGDSIHALHDHPMLRLALLFLGPPAIVGFAYLVARPDYDRSRSVSNTSVDAENSIATVEAASAGVRAAQTRVSGVPDAQLIEQCQRTREALMRRLGIKFSSAVHAPFVIVGDTPESDLNRLFRETIAPTARALAIAFFDRPPDRPISIVLLSRDESYQSCALQLDGQRRAAFAGYYERQDHRVVVNVATGKGTIAHELAHALGHFDFPEMPEWFDEGLASLHEDARFSADHLRIAGLPNWRKRDLLPALRKGTLQSLEQLITGVRVRPNRQAVDYAHARFFCLFLQQRGLLEPFYRKFRSDVANDPTGLRTMEALFGVTDLTPVDDEFRHWIQDLDRKPPRKADDSQVEAANPTDAQ